MPPPLSFRNSPSRNSNRNEGTIPSDCVRDLILNQTPKDFHIITSAELKEVMRTFSWCEIVGKRFPVCHVQLDCTIVEVSSFDAKFKADFEFSHHTEALNGVDRKDHLRWMNCLNRDFTINGLRT